MAQYQFKAFTKKDLENTAQFLVTQLEELELQTQRAELSDNVVEVIKQAAQRYLLVLQIAEPKIQQFEYALKQLKELYKQILPSTTVQKAIQKYERSKSLFLASRLGNMVLEETDIFQQALIGALGGTLKTIYSFQGQLYDISNIPASQIFKTAYSSRRKFQGVYNSTTIKTLIDANLVPTVEFDEGVKPVYQEALQRYKYTKQTGIFWNFQKYRFQKVQSQGSIEEAFTYFGLVDQQRFENITNKEQQIEIFVEEGVTEVKNISGRLQGDLRVNQIEYAVKSMGASMAGLRQFKRLANQIVADSFTDISQLEQVRERDAARGRKINALASELTPEINQLITNYFS